MTKLVYLHWKILQTISKLSPKHQNVHQVDELHPR